MLRAVIRKFEADRVLSPTPELSLQPYKDGTAPEGFVAAPQHEKGGSRPELRAKLTHETHPAVYVAHMGFDPADVRAVPISDE